MNDHFKKLLAAMDDKLWLRMLVCFLPGLVLGKLAGQFPGAILGGLGTVALIAGVAIFLMWPRLRKIGVEEADAEVGDEMVEPVAAPAPLAEPRPSLETSQLMKQLLEMFGGAGGQMIGAIETELLVNPELSYAGAVELAYRRKQLQTTKT